MLKWLNKLIGAGDIGSEADPTENADIKTVVPLIIPRECAVPEWPGPVVVLGDLPFAVSWAAIPSPNRFNYVTHDQATLWKSNDIDWRNVAMRNLEEITAAKRWSGYKDDSSGKPFVVVMLHDDAFGPSRLLLPHLLDDVLGSDYHVAIPERTCAVAYRRSLTADEKADVDGMIEGCFQHGTEPMSDQRFSPQDFWTLPEATVS